MVATTTTGSRPTNNSIRRCTIPTRRSHALVGRHVLTRRRVRQAAVCGALQLACLLALLAAATPTRLSAQNVPERLDRVYLPESDLDAIIERDGRGVILSRFEFEELWQQARENQARLPRQQQTAFEGSLDYQGQWLEEHLLLTLSARFRQFAPGWQTIELPMRSVSVESATLDGEPARIGRRGDSLFVLNETAGSHQLVVQLSVTSNLVGSDRVAAFSLPTDVPGQLQLEIPDGQRLLFNDLDLGTNDATTYSLPVGGQPELILTRTTGSGVEQTDQLVFASSALALNVAPGELTWQASTTIQVYGQSLDELEFDVPSTLEIARVDAGGLESWELSDSEAAAGRTTIRLRFRQPVRGSRKISIRGISATPIDEPWSVPNLNLQGATAQTGRIQLRYPRGVRLVLQDAEGVRQATETGGTDEGGSAVPATESLQTFDIWNADFELSFVTQSKQRELQTNVTSLISVSDEGVDLQSVFGVQPLYASLFVIEIPIPAEWQIENVSLNTSGIHWRTTADEAGTNLLQIELHQPVTPGNECQLTIDAHHNLEDWPDRTDTTEFALPDVRITDSRVTEGTLMVRAPQQLDLTPLELENLAPTYLGLEGERAGFRYQSEEFTGRLQITRRPTRLTSTTLSVSRLDPDALRVHLESQLTIEGGGVLSLDVQLPENVSPDVRFRLVSDPAHPAELIEQPLNETASGRRTWRLKFDRRVLGQPVLWTQIELPRDELQEIEVPRLTIAGGLRSDGFTAIEASFEQLLTLTAVDANQQPLRDVDPVDLPASRAGYQPQERIVAAYRSVTAEHAVRLSARKLQQTAVPIAICDQLNLDTVVGRSGQLHHRTALSFRVSGVQSLRIKLPEACELWATLLDDEPIEVHRTDNQEFTIPLSGQAEVARQRSLQIFYRIALGEDLPGRGRLIQELPEFRVESGSGILQPLEILKRSWQVHYPNELYLLRSRGSFVPSSELSSDSFLARMTRVLELREGEDLLYRGGGLIMVGVIMGLVGLVLRLLGRAAGFLGTKGCLLVGGAALLLGFMGLFALLIQPLASRQPMSFTGEAADTAAPDSAAEWEDGASGAFGEAATNEFLMEGLEADHSHPMEMADETGAEAPQRGLGAGFGQRSQGFFESEDRESKSEDAPQTDPFAPPVAAQPASPTNVPQFNQQRPSLTGGVDAQRAAEADTDELLAIRVPATGGRLSVAMELPMPGNMRTESFEFLGNEQGAAGVLDVDYEDLQAASLMRFCVAAGVVIVLFVLLRNRSLALRMVLLIFGIAGPFALVAFAPAQWQTALDGVLLGTLMSGVLWCLAAAVRACVCCCQSIRQFCCRLSSAWLFVLLAHGAVAEAQPPNAAANGSNAPSQNAQPEAQSGQLTPAASDTAIYIPYRDGDNPLTSERVFIPHQTFLKLWNAAHPDDVRRAPAPSPGMISAAAYAARLQQEAGLSSISVRGRIVLHNLEQQPVELELPLTDVAIQSAQLDGSPAVIRSRTRSVPVQQVDDSDAANQTAGAEPQEVSTRLPIAQNAAPQRPPVRRQQVPTVLVPTAGVHVLDLEFRLPVQLTGPAGQFTLQLSSTPAALLSFELPQSGLDVMVNQSSNRHRIRREADSQAIEVAVDQGGRTTISWQPPQSDNVMDTIVHAESSTVVEVDDRGLTLQAAFDYSVRQGLLNEVHFRLPANLRLEQVSGVDVGGWERTEGDDDYELKVFLRRTVTDQTRVSLTLFQAVEIPAEDSIEVPLPELTPLRLTRETGRVGLAAPPHLSLRPQPSTALRQIGVSAFQPLVADHQPKHTLVGAYEFRIRPWTMSLTLSRNQPSLTASAQHAALVELHRIRLTSLIQLELRGAPRSRLAFRMPVDFQPLTVQAPNLTDWFTTTEGFDELLVLELSAARTGSLEVLIEGQIARQADDEFCEVDTPLLMDVAQLNSTLAVWFDDTFAPQLDEAPEWRSIPNNQLEAQTRELQTRPANFALRTNVTDTYGVSFILDRTQALLTGETATIVNVFENAVELSMNIRWQIRNSATDRFILTTPAEFAGRLEFRNPAIRAISSEETPEGRLRWTIVTRAPQKGSFYVLGVATAGPPETGADAQIVAPAIELQLADAEADGGFRALDTQRHFVILANHSPYELSVADPERLVTAAGEDIHLTLPEDVLRSATTLARVRDPLRPVIWNVRRYQQAAANPATVNLAELTTVLEHDGSWRTQARYRTRNQTRQFLPVRLPENARVLSAVVNGRPVRPVITTVNINEQDVTVHLLALPKTSAADLSFPIQLVVAGQLDLEEAASRFRIRGRQLDIPVPRIVSVQESAQFGVPVMQVVWKLYLPEDWDAEPLDDPEKTNLTPRAESDVDYLEELARLKEANELVAILESKASSKQNFRAINNLNMTWNELSRLQSEFSSSQSKRYGKASEIEAEIQQQLTELAGNVDRYAKQAQLDDQQGRAVLDFRQGGAQSQLDNDEQRLLIEGRNSFLLSNNGVAVDGLQADDIEFNYRSDGITIIAQPEEQAAGKKAPQSKGKALDESVLRNRRRAYVDNLKQLEQQNTAVAADALPQQQAPQMGQFLTNQAQPFGLGGKFTAPQYQQQLGRPMSMVTGPGAGTTSSSEGGQAVAKQEVEVPTVEGLSLDLEIPTRGQLLTMTKVGGGPQLVLQVRPSTVERTGYGALWSVTWLVSALLLVGAIWRRKRIVCRNLGWSTVGLGCVLAAGLPLNLLWMGVLLFAFGCLCLFTPDRRATRCPR